MPSNLPSATPPSDPASVTGDVLAVVPAHNEARFIGSVVVALHMRGIPCVVVDDGSTDATAEIARTAGAMVLQHPSNMGKAGALNTAFALPRVRDAGVVILLDADGQHDVREIPTLVDALRENSADVVIGSRYLPDSTGQIPRSRRLGQRLLTIASNVASSEAVTDSQSGFRALSHRARSVMQFRAAGFGAETEMQFHARSHRLKVVEVPIRAIYTAPPKRSALRHAAEVVSGILRLMVLHRPLLFFAAPGLLTAIAGLALGGFVVATYVTTQLLPIGFTVLTVGLVIVGAIGVLFGVLLHVLRQVADGISRGAAERLRHSTHGMIDDLLTRDENVDASGAIDVSKGS